MHLGVGVADRPQPPGVHRPRLEGLELEVVVPLAGVVAVQALAVDRGDLARDLAHRLAHAELADHGGAGRAQPDRAAHVEPGGVERDPLQVRRPLVGPQRQRQPAGRVGSGHDVVVAVAVDDPAPGGVDVVEVLTDVGDEVGRLPLAQAPPVAAQVDRVEVVAAVDPPVGVLLVEEVVVEAVHVEHGLGGRLRGSPPHEGGDDRPLLVLVEVDGLRGVRRPQDLVDLSGLVAALMGPSLPRFVLKQAQPQLDNVIETWRRRLDSYDVPVRGGDASGRWTSDLGELSPAVRHPNGHTRRGEAARQRRLAP